MAAGGNDDRSRAGLPSAQDRTPRLSRNAREGDLGVYLSTERANGGWRYRIEVRNYAHPEYPKQGRSRVTRPSAAEALEVYEHQLASIRAKRGHTVGQLLDAWIDQHDAQPHTLATYRRNLEALADLTVCIVDVDRRMVQEWVERYATSGKKGKRAVCTQKVALSNLYSLFEWASDPDRALLPSNPVRKIQVRGKPNRGKPQLREDEVIEFVLEALRRIYGSKLARKRGAFGALFALLGSFRRGEVLQLTTRDVNRGGALIYGAQHQPKTDSAPREILLPDWLAAPLHEYVQTLERGARLFPFGENWIYRHINSICADADVPRVTPHGLRGTHASMAAEQGSTSLAIARMLGHSSTQITELAYARANSLRKRDALKVFDRIGDAVRAVH